MHCYPTLAGSSLEFFSFCSANRKLDHLRAELCVIIFLVWAWRFALKASKCTDAQKTLVIKHGEEGAKVAEIWRKAVVN